MSLFWYSTVFSEAFSDVWRHHRQSRLLAISRGWQLEWLRVRGRGDEWVGVGKRKFKKAGIFDSRTRVFACQGHPETAIFILKLFLLCFLLFNFEKLVYQQNNIFFPIASDDVTGKGNNKDGYRITGWFPALDVVAFCLWTTSKATRSPVNHDLIILIMFLESFFSSAAQLSPPHFCIFSLSKPLKPTISVIFLFQLAELFHFLCFFNQVMCYIKAAPPSKALLHDD